MRGRGARLALAALAASCATGQAQFPVREPFTVDTDTRPVSVPCRRDPTPKQPERVTCAPVEYQSPFVWDHVDNLLFAPLSRRFGVEVAGEASNANSLDEVADSAWFTNRGGAPPPSAALALGACRPEDLLPAPDKVPDGAWVIDHGKDVGSTLGFRVDVPGQGRYMLKADDLGKPERASAASVIGAALYHAIGFFTSCEQIVLIRKEQLRLTPGLHAIDNYGVDRPFDAAALDKVLASSTQLGGLVRMQASKWLPGLAIGPFRYVGTRDDDPNDVIEHQNRRELRGSRLLAAWLHHWDAREENTLDVWLASDAERERSSPGYVRHHIIDTSDALGGQVGPSALVARVGFTYLVDWGDVFVDFVTLGAIERPWDRAAPVPGRETFADFSARDFDPEGWKPLYPNPAFVRMTERDGAWMARLIARFSPADIRAIVDAARFRDPTDAEYVTGILLERQRRILARYLARLSPLGEVHAVGPDQICARDLARARGVFPLAAFRYRIHERRGGERLELEPSTRYDGTVCFRPAGAGPDGRVIVEIDNGTGAGPLVIHAVGLGPQGLRVLRVTRPRRRLENSP